ncbi:SsgA family sporulation/cell division regulator [Streptomyces sp. NBC_01622]|uniref:SsgA family sporulation/cell division regulator n=1 Tax=Streptomyces sp. NBC_01622 TaxID=2975903 RepID=UPI00386FFE7C|nr:SsgA family sporulation/cell division regulator [Streptomyces sp. NBC_01622]
MTQLPDDPQLTVGTTGFVVVADDEGAIIATELVYRPDDCLAARLVLLGPDGIEVRWTFAWDLLARGLMSPAGDGDITVRPARGPIDGIEVSLVSPSTARVWLPGDGVAEFVRKVRGRVGVDARGIAPALDKELAAITDGT